jgi:hypothetical protein
MPRARRKVLGRREMLRQENTETDLREMGHVDERQVMICVVRNDEILC